MPGDGDRMHCRSWQISSGSYYLTYFTFCQFFSKNKRIFLKTFFLRFVRVAVKNSSDKLNEIFSNPRVQRTKIRKWNSYTFFIYGPARVAKKKSAPEREKKKKKERRGVTFIPFIFSPARITRTTEKVFRGEGGRNSFSGEKKHSLPLEKFWSKIYVTKKKNCIPSRKPFRKKKRKFVSSRIPLGCVRSSERWRSPFPIVPSIFLDFHWAGGNEIPKKIENVWDDWSDRVELLCCLKNFWVRSVFFLKI